MAVIAVGDVTTQFRIWIDANATGGDVNTKMRPPLNVATGEAVTTDLSTNVMKFIVK